MFETLTTWTGTRLAEGLDWLPEADIVGGEVDSVRTAATVGEVIAAAAITEVLSVVTLP